MDHSRCWSGATYPGQLQAGKYGRLQSRPVYWQYTVEQKDYWIGILKNTTLVYPREYRYTEYRISY